MLGSNPCAHTLHIRGKSVLGRLDLNTLVDLISKEISFIDPAVKQTPHM